MFKPFKPPSFVRPSIKNPTSGDETRDPPAKRRKIVQGTAAQAELNNAKPSWTGGDIALGPSVPTARAPLKTIKNAQNTTSTPKLIGPDISYAVLWRKPTTKKNKTWDGDGYLRVSQGLARLRDPSGKELGRCAWERPLLPGSQLKIAGREIEVESLLSNAEAAEADLGSSISEREVTDDLEDEVDGEESVDSGSRAAELRKPFKTPYSSQPAASPLNPATGWRKPRELTEPIPSLVKNAASRSIQTISSADKPSVLNSSYHSTALANVSKPRHDPNASNALVMSRPRDAPVGKQIVDVVVDPILSDKLRSHQREGVKFLYDCVMGLTAIDGYGTAGNGAILADDMGLGKTLQTITLIWTLLKQNPFAGEGPVIKKALIVCPVTLINNWRKEFRKWLGADRIGVLVADDKKTRISNFTRGRSYSVLVIGYDRLRSVFEQLQKANCVDLIVADEGHRLKTSQSKAAQAIQSLETPRRIILSGTPIQNNLSEFFSMVDFVNPGALGSLKAFTKNYEMPIERSRQPNASEDDLEKGEACSEELAGITKQFILRRTAEILAKYLPPKTETVLLCRPTKSQAEVYRHVLASPLFQSALGSSDNALQLITLLKKVCNSPQLLATDATAEPDKAPLAQAVASQIPSRLLRNASASSKIQVLDQLLYSIRNKTDEKVVIVSNFTSTLDILENLLTSLSMPFGRLDGSTPSSKRQELVDFFNRSSSSTCFAFLLSAKAGGVGINLIGASRLILFDVDWNPAVDLQAMARIHRDGQRRPCYIYRLLVAGGLDEKIWQRQLTKLGLASSVLDLKGGQASFTKEELKDLFRLDDGPGCQTHELIGCDCGGAKTVEQSLATEAEVDLAVVELSDKEDDAPDSLLTPSLDKAGEGGDNDPYNEDSDLDLLPPTRRRRGQKQPTQSGKDVPAAHDSRRRAGRGMPMVIKASELDRDADEDTNSDPSRLSRRGPQQADEKRGISECLAAYSHIDTSRSAQQDGTDLSASIQDEILQHVLADEDSLVNFVFSRTTK